MKTVAALSETRTQLAKDIYAARLEMTGMAWIGMDKTVKGTLIEKMREAMKEGETLPGNDRLAHLVSLVSRHVNGDAAAAIDDALAKYVSKKRSLRASVLSGAADLSNFILV